MWFWLLTVVVLAFSFVLLWGAPYLPSKRRQMQVAIEMLHIKKGSVVLDLGSGDGAFLLAAARAGATVHGYELNPVLFAISWVRCLPYRERVHIKLANYWNESFPTDTTAVYVFLLTRFMKRLDSKMEAEAARVGHDLHLASFTFAVPGRQAVVAKEGVFLYKYSAKRP